MTLKIPEMPELPADLPPALREWCETVELILRLREGLVGPGTNTRFVTIQDLINAGLISEGDLT